MALGIADLIQQIKNCSLCEIRKYGIIPPERLGNPYAKAMIIGRNPSLEAIRLGHQWPAGRTIVRSAFRQALSELKMDGELEDYFWMTDLVKCGTPKNEPPGSKELANCKRFIKREIEVLKPRFIIAFGRDSWNFLKREYRPVETNPSPEITGVHTHGGWRIIEFKEGFKAIPLIHPSRAQSRIDLHTYEKHVRRAFIFILRELQG